jgi:twitching motility protein PilT
VAPVELETLLALLVQVKGSDLHLCANEPPTMRVQRIIRRTRFPELTSDEVERMLRQVAGEERWERLAQERELDMALVVPGAGRFRVNLYRERDHPAACFHRIPSEIQTIDELGLPQVLKEIALLPRGLVLVTGPTGSGKSTTLAALIDHVNECRPVHVITIEDPVEFIHKPKMASITQREIGLDTHSFAEALRHVMRQNPDVILVGEMRDLETIQLAITAGETGHLVFATLHTLDAAQTMDRIVDVFEPHRQEQVRAQLSITLEAVISQDLLHRKDETGLVPAFEVMIATPGIRNLIRERKTHQIYSLIQGGGDIGMQTLDQHLLRLYSDGVIDAEEAMAKATHPEEFARKASIDTGKGKAKPQSG